jgi:hypothetical protein
MKTNSELVKTGIFPFVDYPECRRGDPKQPKDENLRGVQNSGFFISITDAEQKGDKMDESTKELGWYALAVTICTLIMLAVFGLVSKAHAEVYSNEQIANAIYRAEGGARTLHPYGILQHYRTTSPRQACLNTIAHARKDWNGKGDFILFLQRRYAPLNAANDPRHLNNHWYKNVMYFLEVNRG